MAAIEIIPTYTVILAQIPPVDIITYYLDPDAGAIFQVFINEQYQYISGLFVLEGYGIVIADSAIVPVLLDIFVDNDGHLYLNGQDETKYSIDANGHLIYTA